MAHYTDPLTFSGPLTNGPGPRTPQGKAIAARNATTHGLFARDVVLPQLGEDPDAFYKVYMTLCFQVEPQNLIERHYVEAICAASWRLRRLHRWQAQVYEDETLTEDERLTKLDKILRHETALHRQIDKAVKMLARDVPDLFGRRARDRALAELGETERTCRADIRADADVADRARGHLQVQGLPHDFDYADLDNTHPAPQTPPQEVSAPAATPECQNEPGDEPWDDADCPEKDGPESAEDDKTPDAVQAQDPVQNEARAAGYTPPPAYESAKSDPPRLNALPHGKTPGPQPEPMP